MLQLFFTDQENKDLNKLETNNALLKRLKAVRKTLVHLETNPRHPSLNTHKYTSLEGPSGEEVFEAYAETKHPQLIKFSGTMDPIRKKLQF